MHSSWLNSETLSAAVSGATGPALLSQRSDSADKPDRLQQIVLLQGTPLRLMLIHRQPACCPERGRGAGNGHDLGQTAQGHDRGGKRRLRQIALGQLKLLVPENKDIKAGNGCGPSTIGQNLPSTTCQHLDRGSCTLTPPSLDIKGIKAASTKSHCRSAPGAPATLHTCTRPRTLRGSWAI